MKAIPLTEEEIAALIAENKELKNIVLLMKEELEKSWNALSEKIEAEMAIPNRKVKKVLLEEIKRHADKEILKQLTTMPMSKDVGEA